MRVERNAAQPRGPLVLCTARSSTCCACMADGESVSFRQEGGKLIIDNPPDGATLHARDPQHLRARQEHRQLSGLYTSGGGFFTQCEAEGFRRITYFLDRPDVMAVYTVTLRADKGEVPGAAEQRQPAGGRGARQRPPLRQVARPLPQAQLPVRAGGRDGWWPRAAHPHARARTTCCRSTCAAATSTRPSTR
jgi:hypothetical protein